MFKAMSPFDKYLEKATSNMLLDPDWEANLQLCDIVRQNDVSPKYAISTVKKKIYNQNPNVSYYALIVLETLMKNCGSLIHDEVATKSFMEELRDLVRSCTNEKVRDKVLELIQVWAHAFRHDQKYRAVQDTLNIMKAEGHDFPVLKESDAMFSADTAPKWAEGDCCHRCRVQFSVFRRKHHCRACGQIFCDSCSNHMSTIPKYGIERAVRICNSCFEQQQSKPSSSVPKPDSTSSSSDHSGGSSPQQGSSQKKTEQDLKEEDELQLALALSRSEAEAKEKEKLRSTQMLLSRGSPTNKTEQKETEKAPEYSGDLGRYLDRGYWEKREQETVTTTTVVPEPSAPMTIKVDERYQNGENDDLDDFMMTLKGQLDIFVTRMKSNSSRGRPIAMDSSIETLFMNITAMHSQLLKRIQDYDDQRAYYERLQEKVDDVRSARGALNALREDHMVKIRKEQEEQLRQRQAQMQHKLHIMRQKKHEYLEYQRQIALQRIQEQEREMQMRIEQQKQQYRMGAVMPATVTYAPTYMPPPHMPPDGSPHHTGYQPPPGAPPFVPAAPIHHPPYAQPPYNMQAMAGALPPAGYSVPPAPPEQAVAPQPHMPVPQTHLPVIPQSHQPVVPQGSAPVPPPGAPVPPTGAPVPPTGAPVPPVQVAPTEQPPPQPPQEQTAELISFD